MSPGCDGLRVRLLGAPGTGKTRLAAELRSALSALAESTPPLTLQDLPAFLPPPAAPDSRCLVLLMGLDLPAAAAEQAARAAADRDLRHTLAQAGVAYQVVYGLGAERTRQAVQALQAWLPAQPGARDDGQETGPAAVAAPPIAGQRQAGWSGSCDHCSDPQAERRLLSDLLATRASRAAPT